MPDRNALPYLFLALGVLALALAGYAGYVLYPRFDLPAVTGAGLLFLAAAAGIASFFSPCSFSLLVTLLARETGAGQMRKAPLGRALGFALALSVGASAFLLLTGALIAAGGGPVFERVTFTSTAGRLIRVGVGMALVFLGLVQTGVLRISLYPGVAGLVRTLERAEARLRRVSAAPGFALFGFGYLLAGFG